MHRLQKHTNFIRGLRRNCRMPSPLNNWRDNMIIQSEEEYLQARGFGALSDYTIDKDRIPHGETNRQRIKRLDNCQKAITAFYEAKQAARREYRQKVERGEIRPPTALQTALQVAQGNEESEQTQAARRLLAKRGIDWETGKNL